MKKSELFADFLSKFETDELRDYCKDMIELMPDYIFQIPSSTTYKYHNKSQCRPGGQIFHVLMCCEVINYVLDLEYIQNKIIYPKKRDCMRIAMALHDALKCGADGGTYTVHEHPLLASEWVKTTSPEHDIKQGLKDYIGSLIESHSGQWVESKKSKTILPKPQDDEHFIIHLCDYLSSRSNIDMLYSDEQTVEIINNALPDPKDYFMPFGKYKGVSFEFIESSDKPYLVWLRDMSDMELHEPLKSMLDRIGDDI